MYIYDIHFRVILHAFVQFYMYPIYCVDVKLMGGLLAG